MIRNAYVTFEGLAPPITSYGPAPSRARLRYNFEYDPGTDRLNVFHPDYKAHFNILTNEDFADTEERMKKYQALNTAFTEKIKTNGNETIEGFYKGQATNYFLEATHLGFINCDRFVGTPREKLTNVMVKADDWGDNVQLVFRDIRSIMAGRRYRDGYIYFENIPVGEPVTVFGIKEKDGSPLFAFNDFKIEKDKIVSLNYTTITYKELNEQIARLN